MLIVAKLTQDEGRVASMLLPAGTPRRVQRFVSIDQGASKCHKSCVAVPNETNSVIGLEILRWRCMVQNAVRGIVVHGSVVRVHHQIDIVSEAHGMLYVAIFPAIAFSLVAETHNGWVVVGIGLAADSTNLVFITRTRRGKHKGATGEWIPLGPEQRHSPVVPFERIYSNIVDRQCIPWIRYYRAFAL